MRSRRSSIRRSRARSRLRRPAWSAPSGMRSRRSGDASALLWLYRLEHEGKTDQFRVYRADRRQVAAAVEEYGRFGHLTKDGPNRPCNMQPRRAAHAARRGCVWEGQRLPLIASRGAVCASRRLRGLRLSIYCCTSLVSVGADRGVRPYKHCGGDLSPSRLRRQPPLGRGGLSARSSPERIAFRAGSGEKKTFSPRCPSSFLNLKSSENCLIERERGFLPLSLFPRCSVAELYFMVF